MNNIFDQMIAPTVAYLDCCDSAPITVSCKAPKKECNKMRDDIEIIETSEDERKAAYLQSQLSMVNSKRRSENWVTFHMDGPPQPTSPKEFADRIKAGQFTFDMERLNEDGSWRTDKHPYFSIYDFVRYISWNIKGQMPDEAGYAAARDKLDAARQAAERQIVVGTPTEGLKALQDFEATTFH